MSISFPPLCFACTPKTDRAGGDDKDDDVGGTVASAVAAQSGGNDVVVSKSTSRAMEEVLVRVEDVIRTGLA